MGEREEGDDGDWRANHEREEKGETIGLARVARQGAHKGSRNSNMFQKNTGVAGTLANTWVTSRNN